MASGKLGRGCESSRNNTGGTTEETMNRRIDYDFTQAIRTDQDSTPFAQPEPFAAQLGQPDVEDCSNGVIPDKAEPMDGKKKILVPVLITMNKFLFDNYRLSMYTYMNKLLRNGTLSRIVGARVLNQIINRDVLSFPHVSFWRINRTSFYADVGVLLKLNTQSGTLIWNGYLVLWCGFNDEFECSFEYLTDNVDREDDGFDQLDSYLIPYYNNKRVDEAAESIWRKYLPEALVDPNARIASDLAAKMGLEIKSCRIYGHEGVSTILFFEDDDLVVGKDSYEKDENGIKRRIMVKDPNPEHIKGGTIVVNENLTKWEYSAYGVYHECYHFEEHYLFYLLQKMGSNDPRKVTTKEIIVDANNEPKDAIHIMEKQANRGAYGLMLPATSTREMIERLYNDIGARRHAGERYEAVGINMRTELSLPYFRIRARMIQLGYIQAKGSLNYVDRHMIQPFAFDIDAWREEQHTFIIDQITVNRLYKEWATRSYCQARV